MSDKTKRQVVGMSIGILIHNMILLLICLIFFRTVPVIAGVLIGAAAAEVLLISIARSTELCVESADGAYSSKKMAYELKECDWSSDVCSSDLVIHSLIRSLCAVILVCLLWKFTTINLLAVVLGALGLKTGAYVYPVLQKRTDRMA